MRPRFAEIAKRYPNIITETYDFDFDTEASSYEPGNILPVFILVDDNGNEKGRLIGEHKIEEMVNLIETNL
jgi:hypothetical protein